MNKRLIGPEVLPRRLRNIYRNEDPPSLRSYSTTFLPAACRLMSSFDELAKEVQSDATPLRHFISTLNLKLSQPKCTEWTEEQLERMLDRARRVQINKNDLTKGFLSARGNPSWTVDTSGWRTYRENQAYIQYWDGVVRCNFDWDWDLSECLEQFFEKPRVKDPWINLDLEQQDEWTVDSTTACAPGMSRVRYISQTGNILYRTVRSGSSAGVVNTESHTSDDRAPPSIPEHPHSDLPLEGELVCDTALEYREINRHARRKIEAWLNHGWRASWRWNGLYDRWIDQCESAHWMTLKRPRTNISTSSPSSKRRIRLEFPKTPCDPDWGSDSESDSDSDPQQDP